MVSMVFVIRDFDQPVVARSPQFPEALLDIQNLYDTWFINSREWESALRAGSSDPLSDGSSPSRVCNSTLE